MKSLVTCLTLLCPALFLSVIGYSQNTPQLGKQPIPEIIKAMTLEEKARFVVGKGFSMPGMNAAKTDN